MGSADDAASLILNTLSFVFPSQAGSPLSSGERLLKRSEIRANPSPGGRRQFRKPGSN